MRRLIMRLKEQFAEGAPLEQAIRENVQHLENGK
jgi:hypothetical protein